MTTGSKPKLIGLHTVSKRWATLQRRQKPVSLSVQALVYAPSCAGHVQPMYTGASCYTSIESASRGSTEAMIAVCKQFAIKGTRP